MLLTLRYVMALRCIALHVLCVNAFMATYVKTLFFTLHCTALHYISIVYMAARNTTSLKW